MNMREWKAIKRFVGEEENVVFNTMVDGEPVSEG